MSEEEKWYHDFHGHRIEPVYHVPGVLTIWQAKDVNENTLRYHLSKFLTITLEVVSGRKT